MALLPPDHIPTRLFIKEPRLNARGLKEALRCCFIARDTNGGPIRTQIIGDLIVS